MPRNMVRIYLRSQNELVFDLTQTNMEITTTHPQRLVYRPYPGVEVRVDLASIYYIGESNSVGTRDYASIGTRDDQE